MNNPCGVPEPSSWIAFLLRLISSSFRDWVVSGCAAESLLLLLGPPHHWSVSRYTLLAILHFAYALASTSWLFRLVFTASCWPLVFVTSLVQYAVVSRITRGRLRTVWKSAHFHKDRIAFFNLPALLLGTGVNGSLTVRGVTVSLLDLTIDFHAIELEMNLGSGHELSVQTDGLRFSLFRDITIEEVYGVHWYTAPATGVGSQRPHISHDLNGDEFSRSKSNSLSNRLLGRASDDESAPRKRDLLKEKVTSDSADGNEPTIKAGRPMTIDKRSLGAKVTLSRADIEAEQRYEDVLGELRTRNRLHQSRARVQKARETGDTNLKEEVDYHPLLCSDLRNAKSPQVPSTGKVSLTKMIDMFEPISRQLDRVPIVPRLSLWFLSQSHKITCPSICFSGSGHYLGDILLESLFSKYVGDDQRIEALKQEVSTWLSSADVYITLSNIVGHASVPLLTSNDITTEVRSNQVVVSRIGEQAADSGLVTSLSGADGHFTIPTCLLPSHSYLAPGEDTAPVSMSIRASLPAYFSDSFLQFATTLSKTSQMLDIEEEWSRSNSMDSSTRPAPDTDMASDEPHSNPDSRSQRLRDKLRPHGQLSHVLKHPMEHAKQNLHREFKKTAVDKVDGAWMARWTNKLLKKLEGLDGDLGYTTQIPVQIPRGKKIDGSEIKE